MNDRFRFKALQEVDYFLESMDKKMKKKVMFNIWKTKTIIDKELFKHIQGGIWAFRTLYNKKYIRLFAFWDRDDGNDTIVVGTHGIYKTTAKIPKSDIDRAKRIRSKYFNNKK